MRIANSNVQMGASHTYREKNKHSLSKSSWNTTAGYSTLLQNIGIQSGSSGLKNANFMPPNSNFSLQDNLQNHFERTQSVKGTELQSKADAIRKMRDSMLDYLLRLLFGTNQSLGNTVDDEVHPIEETNGSANLSDFVPSTSGLGGRIESSFYYEEHESVSFETTATVQTADGKTYDISLGLELSRSFVQQTEQIINYGAPFCTDPLVINLDSSSFVPTDQKFLFDLDCDGKEEEISFAQQGSGFLAYDKNGDGIINDGSELFGTQTGNGFKDLAQYDTDGNGWIDEADEIFDKLKIWTKDAQGNDTLIALGKAGVGAIYLGSASTDFALTNDSKANASAFVRRTGMFLYENGMAGTMQQVDLVTKTVSA